MKHFQCFCWFGFKIVGSTILKIEKELLDVINLGQIFEKQNELNKEMALQHKEYQTLSREALTRNYILAALVESGECCNEWAQFKIWKSTRKENREALCPKCHGTGKQEETICPYCEQGVVNPLREEYSDILHFATSVAIGFDLEPNEVIQGLIQLKEISTITSKDTYQLFLELYKQLVYANVLIEEFESILHTDKLIQDQQKERKKVAKDLMLTVIKLGYSLGFDDNEIEQAYFAKHQINQIRQIQHY